MHGHNTDVLLDDPLKRRLLNDFQHGFPISPTPYKDIGEQLGISEVEVLSLLATLQDDGFISQIGAVFRANSVCASMLAAMAVPEDDLDRVAQIISAYDEVNHNYEREHHYNLWFVVTAEDDAHLQNVLLDMEKCTACPVLFLPMLHDYHIDLGFELKWT